MFLHSLWKGCLVQNAIRSAVRFLPMLAALSCPKNFQTAIVRKPHGTMQTDGCSSLKNLRPDRKCCAECLLQSAQRDARDGLIGCTSWRLHLQSAQRDARDGQTVFVHGPTAMCYKKETVCASCGFRSFTRTPYRSISVSPFPKESRTRCPSRAPRRTRTTPSSTCRLLANG